MARSRGLNRDDSLMEYWLREFPERSTWDHPDAQAEARAGRCGVIISLLNAAPKGMRFGTSIEISIGAARQLAQDIERLANDQERAAMARLMTPNQDRRLVGLDPLPQTSDHQSGAAPGEAVSEADGPHV